MKISLSLAKLTSLRLGLFLCVLFLSCVVFIESVSAQSYVADTVRVSFSPHPDISFNNTLYVHDAREVNPDFVSIYEKKKWLVFPVDQIVKLDSPLADGFKQHKHSKSTKAYQLDIFDFDIDNKKSLFKRFVNLTGAFQLSRIEAPGDTVLIGAFYYETYDKYTKKAPLDTVYSEVINNFRTDLLLDLMAVTADSMYGNKSEMKQFRPGSPVVDKNFYISTDAYYGYTFWGFDAELYFSSPEPSRMFSRNSRMFRFLQYENRQSVAFAPSVSYMNYRINDNFLFQNKSAFLVGINKWDDIDEESRTIEELFLFQFSMTQRLTLNRFDGSGFNLGIGLFEEASYVIYNKPMFHVGLVLHCAYKF